MRQNFGPWSFDDTPPSFGEQLTIARIEWCLDTLKKARARVAPSSRLPSALALLRRVHAKGSMLEDAGMRAKIAEIQRFAWEFMIILLAALKADPDTSPYTYEKIREMLGGSLLPDNSHARNIQFELYASAIFAVSRFNVRAGPPDARLAFYGEDTAIEAKRVHSLNPDTLRRSFAEAARQITGKSSQGSIHIVRSRGLIAINVDSYFDDVDPTADGRDLIREFEKRLVTVHKESRVLRDNTAIFGLLICGHVARWRRIEDPAHWRIDTLFPMQWVGLHGDDPTDALLTNHFTTAMSRVADRMLELRSKVPKPM